MKFYFLVSSILLGVTARTATADESLSCDDQDQLRSQFPDCSCVTKCPNEAAQCKERSPEIVHLFGCDTTCQGGQACPITTTESFSCDDQDELKSQFPGCSCVLKCPNEAATCIGDGSSAEPVRPVEPVRLLGSGCDIALCEGGRVCPITTTTTDTTEGFDGSVPGETLSCDDQLRSQFPGCSCVIKCPNESAQCHDGIIAGSCDIPWEICPGLSACNLGVTYQTEIHNGNIGAAPSGAGILSSASSTYIGASVAIIAIFV